MERAEKLLAGAAEERSCCTGGARLAGLTKWGALAKR